MQDKIGSRPSLRQLLPVLFFLLAAIPAGAIGVLLTNRAWHREVQKVHEQHLLLAQHLAEVLTRRLLKSYHSEKGVGDET